MSCKDMRDKPSKMSASANSSETKSTSSKEADNNKKPSGGCGCNNRY